ncbi:MAG: cyclase family protein, partial [Prevotellaceae bacterium]|nr:cyclase family protein [Prevotellaceae bacterium]
MKKIIDLTAPMFNGAPTMPMDPKFAITWHCTLETLGYNLSRLTTSTHQGTHIDAPRHFFNKGECIDEIALER